MSLLNTIIFDCERMKYPNTGIYYYCLNLGLELQKKLNPNVLFYAPEKEITHFDKNSVIKQKTLHKILMPKLNNNFIWHTTFQHSDYIPLLDKRNKLVLTIHDLNFLYIKGISEAKKEKYIKGLQSKINRADAVVCVSSYVRNDVLKHCKIPPANIIKIYNGTNQLDKPLLSNKSFKPTQPYLFSIGTIKEQKNFHVIFPILKENPNLQLIIAGVADDSNYLKKIETFFNENGLFNGFKFVGQITEQEKAWYYHNCEAFIFTSLSEGFGLPVIEAMSAGKPVFLSRLTALPEIGGDEAYYFDNFESTSMCRLFNKGMNHFNQNREENSKRNILRAKEFSWEKAASEYINLYNQLIS